MPKDKQPRWPRPEIARAGERCRAIDAVAQRFANPLLHLGASGQALEWYRRIASGFFLNRGMLTVFLALLLAFEVLALRMLRRRTFWPP